MSALDRAAGSRRRSAESLSVASLLQRYTLDFLAKHPRQAAPQVQSTLAKLSLCRTAALGGRKLKCLSCDRQTIVYNSCRDRHCPRCGGARRADWLDRTAELILPGVNYFQVVFTLPDVLSPLVLGNRREVYALLMRAAWRALDETLRKEQGVEPAALLVLHTWNQELGPHPHVHVVVPGGGPSLDGTRWINSRHPRQRRRTKPYLVDNRRLGRTFRDHFCRQLKRLHARGVIAFEPPRLRGRDPESSDEPTFDEWVDRLAETFNVFIEAPPANSRPEHVLKYLARYLSGGPISDARLISHEKKHVTFWARSQRKHSGNTPRPFTLSGVEFVRRWSMHILPRGFTKTRSYGGFSCRRRQDYLQRCRQLLRLAEPEDEPPTQPFSTDDAPEPTGTCPHCRGQLVCVEQMPRPTWRDVFRDPTLCPVWYQPALVIHRGSSSRRIRAPATLSGANSCSL